MKKIALLLFVSFIVSCVTVPQPKVISRMPFPEQEYQNLPKAGSAVVKGQAFLKTRGGDVKFAAGNNITLNPVTSYSNEWYEKHIVQNLRIEKADPRIDNYIKKATADGNGRFVFKNVPHGEYYLSTRITWEAATGYQGALEAQGGPVVKRITVNEGDEIEVMLTR